MILLIITGVVALLSGILFLSGEKNLRSLSDRSAQSFNKVIGKIDDFMISKRVGAGICFILAGLFCLFMAYWLFVMAPKAGLTIL